MPVAFCPVIGYHWEEHLIASHQEFPHMDKIPPEPSPSLFPSGIPCRCSSCHRFTWACPWSVGPLEALEVSDSDQSSVWLCQECSVLNITCGLKNSVYHQTVELAAESKVLVGSTNISQFWWWKSKPFNGSEGSEGWRCFVGSRCWLLRWELLGQVRSQEHSVYIQVYNEMLSPGDGHGVLEVCQDTFYSSPYMLWYGLKRKNFVSFIAAVRFLAHSKCKRWQK